MTLQDRVSGKVAPETKSSGPTSTFSAGEEEALISHVIRMARVGYGYTRLRLRILATDTAAFLRKDRDPKKVLCDSWLTKFLRRHPEVKTKKPKRLEMVRAKTVTKAVIDSYFEELKNILDEHQLHDKPERVFNIDETGLSLDHTPQNVISPVGETVPGITSSKSVTTTMISCVSASGQAVSPYFIFKV